MSRNGKHGSHPAPGTADSYEFTEEFDKTWQNEAALFAGAVSVQPGDRHTEL